MAGLLIGEVARRSEISAHTIRYYERLGLLTRPARSDAGYRRYDESAVEELSFIRKAQSLGFSLDEIKEIIQLSRTGVAPCSRVLALTQDHLTALDERIRDLKEFRDQLATQVSRWSKTPATAEGLCSLILSVGERAVSQKSVRDHERKSKEKSP